MKQKSEMAGEEALLLSVSFMQIQCLRQNSKHPFHFFMASKLLHRNLQPLFTELIRNAINESQNIYIIASSNYFVDLKLKHKIQTRAVATL